MRDLWETISEGWGTLKLFGALRGVRDPVLSSIAYDYGMLISPILFIVAFILGRRHLSWLRGQKEPLPALKAGLLGTLLGPLLFTANLILTAALRYESVLANTLALTGTLLLSLWTLSRVIAWTRNFRSAPPLRVATILATALIALAIAIPLTAAMHSYSSKLQELRSEVIELEVSHQNYFALMRQNDGVSETEKLETAKLGCQNYARKNQRNQLLKKQLIKLGIPEGISLLTSVIGSLLAFAAALFILKKSRTRRA